MLGRKWCVWFWSSFNLTERLEKIPNIHIIYRIYLLINANQCLKCRKVFVLNKRTVKYMQQRIFNLMNWNSRPKAIKQYFTRPDIKTIGRANKKNVTLLSHKETPPVFGGQINLHKTVGSLKLFSRIERHCEAKRCLFI